jgi:hypothetical protein
MESCSTLQYHRSIDRLEGARDLKIIDNLGATIVQVDFHYPIVLAPTPIFMDEVG